MIENLRILGLVARILSGVGALNWGLVGLFNKNLVSLIFGCYPLVENLIYILVGLSGAYMLCKAINKISA